MRPLRISISTLATALALAATSIVPAVQAGTYDVLACDAAPSAVNNSWTFETNDSSHIAGSSVCPSSSDLSGLLATTRLNSGGPSGSPSAYGQWIVRAPAGTTISRIRLRRYLNMDGGTGWQLYGRQADGTTLPGETCTVQPGHDDCTVGGYASGTLDRGVATTSIAYGFVCPTGCTTGATIHAASAAIYSANVTITDPTPPVVGTPTGALVTASGYHKGSESVTFNGTDALGLSARRLLIDGTEVASDAPACDYTRLVPCNPAPAVTLAYDTNLLSDGPHTVQVAVVDAAQNETRSSATPIIVDHTPPAVPQDLQAAARVSTNPAFTASWSNPGGQVAPIAAAHWRLCPSGVDSGCPSGISSGTSLSGTLPAYGRYTLLVALEDAAGNVGPEAPLPLSYDPVTPPPTPTPTATPTVTPTPTPTPRANPHVKVTAATLKRSSRTVTVAGRAAMSATGKVRVKLTYRVGGKSRSRSLTATLKGGRFGARTRLSSGDARRAGKLTVTVAYAGDAHHSAASTRRAVKVRR